MRKCDRDTAASRLNEDYEAPELIVHGTVAEITRGTASGTPDTGAQGSQLPDDSITT